VESIAQTNIQLYNQLRRQGRPPEELALVKRCYELAVSLYSGNFQADGKPFVAHISGVASIVGQLGLPAVIVGAACIHNAYGNGDFGDALYHSATPRRRRIVREAVGAEVESCVHRFMALRLTDKSMLDIPARLDELDARDRNLIAMELADFLEKYADNGVLYYGENRWVTGFVENHGNVLIEIAERLGHPQLGAALREAFAAAANDSVPDVLRSAGHRQFMELVVPRSCRLRLNVAAILTLSRMKRKVLARAGR
jgi:(p)ppGpp synthase/HD superfamily hydrolase